MPAFKWCDMKYRVRIVRRVVIHEVNVIELDAPDEVAARNEAITKSATHGEWKTQDFEIDRYEVTNVEELK